MKPRISIRILAAAALAVTSGGDIAAQTSDHHRFGEVVDVQLVNVEVWVTDRRGEAVHGLTAADFEVLEDGEPVEISHFAELGGQRPVAQVTAADPAGEDPPRPRPEPPAADPGHLVLYFDQLHLKPAGRQRVIGDLRQFLEEAPLPAERVLILNQDFGLTTEATFGSSREQIDAALDRVSESPPLGSRVELEKRNTLRRLQEAWDRAKDLVGGRNADPCQYFVGPAARELEIFARESHNRIEATMDHLASASSFLSGVPGVKTLLYVSDSLERSPGSDLVSFVNGVCPARSDAQRVTLSDVLSGAFHRLTRHANANRVTIYALQAHGLQAGFSGSAVQRALDSQGTRGLDTAVRFSERDGLINLAVETGGRAIFNRNDFDVPLAEIAREMVSYYSLAYEPPHGGDQREHRIDVRVKDRGLSVRHRRGYRDKDPDTRLTERLEGAVYLGLVDNPMGVRLGAGEVRSAGNGRITVPLHVLVPAASVAFLPEEGSLVARLTVQVGTRSPESDKGIFEQSAYRIRRPAAADEELVSVVLELTLPEGVHVIAVGLRDDASRETSVVSTTLELGAAAAAEAS